MSTIHVRETTTDSKVRGGDLGHTHTATRQHLKGRL
jgi:hypothetical protein